MSKRPIFVQFLHGGVFVSVNGASSGRPLSVRDIRSLCFRMMLQHPGPTLADISCSALVPCPSPPGTLTLDDFTDFTPIVKEELRLAIQNKRLSKGLSADVSSDGASSSSDRPSERLLCGSEVKMEVRWRGSSAECV